jgi:hypothetical protein
VREAALAHAKKRAAASASNALKTSAA